MKRFLLFLLLVSCLPVFGDEAIIVSGDSKLHYRTFGKGDPLVFINGGPGISSSGYTTLARQLSKNNRVIIYDQRGTGKSALTHINGLTITLDLMVADLENLRKHLKISTWIVMGQSFGGMLASYYTTKYPDRVSKMILSASGGVDLDLLSYMSANVRSRLSVAERDSLDYWTQRVSRGDTTRAARAKRASFSALAYVYDRRFAPELAEKLLECNELINQLVFNDLRRMRFDCSEALRFFDKPVLVIQGKQDVITEDTARKSASLIRDSRLVLIDDCGHQGWLDKPAVYFGEIEAFLKNKGKISL